MQNLNNSEVQQEAIAVAKARCRLVSSHLSVLPAMVSLEELPQNKNTLFVAEIGEDVYKLNQMVNKLTTAGIVNRISNTIYRQYPNCHPRDKPSLFQLLIEIYK
jgi:muramoyltetrapeptide carboxypeptidase LdcA involved in peptidoglycan recycling